MVALTQIQRTLAERSGLVGLLAYVTPNWRVLVLAVVLMMGESAIALLNPWIAAQLTGVVTQPGAAIAPLPGGFGLLGLMALWALLLVVQSGLSFGNRYLLGSTGATMLADLRSRLYDHLQSLPLGYFHDRRRGDVLALLGNDAAYISHFVTGTLVSLLPLLMTFVGAAYFLFRISPVIAGMAAVLIPLFFLATKLVGRRLRPLSSESVRLHAAMFSTLEENIGMLPAIKSFTREAHESARFQRSNVELLRASKRRLLVESVLSPTVHLLAGSGATSAALRQHAAGSKRCAPARRHGGHLALRYADDAADQRSRRCLRQRADGPRFSGASARGLRRAARTG